MGIAITFYLFRKAVNSTANPHMHPELVEREFTTEIVYKKDMSSVFSPTMNMTGQVLNTDLGTGTYPVPTWNYAYFKGYFYYLTDWVDLGAQNVRFTLQVDALASVAGSNRLAGQRVYVAYKSFVDGKVGDDLPDARQLISGEYSWNYAALGNMPSSSGIYVVYTIGSHNSTGYYLMSSGNLSRLMNAVNSWADVISANTSSGILETLGSVGELLMGGSTMAQCIKSVTWLPFYSTAGTTLSEIYLGIVGTGVAGFKIGDSIASRLMTWSERAQIPFQHRNWKRRPPYTYVTLHLPYFGTIQVDEPLFAGADYEKATEDWSIMHLHYAFDMATGVLSVCVSIGSRATYNSTDGEKILMSTSKQIGVNSAYGAQNSPMGNLIGTAASVVGAAVTGGAAAATLAGVTGVINNSPTIAGVGGGGGDGIGMSVIDRGARIYVVSANINPNRTESGLAGTVGRAYFAPYTLHSLPSARQYIRTSGANFQGIYPKIMLDEVNRAFDEGVWYE